MNNLFQSLETRRLLAAALNDNSAPTQITPFHVTNPGGTILFAADDGVHGRELFASDGTPGGTTLVKDIVPGGVGSNPRDIVSPTANVSYFWTQNEFTDPQLWKTDGTSGGTQLVADLRAVAGHPVTVDRMVNSNGTLLFHLHAGDSRQLLVASDGTGVGTQVIQEFSGSSLQFLASTDAGLFFQASDAQHGYEVWITNGTSADTHLLKDILPGMGSSQESGYGMQAAVLDNVLVFNANSGSGLQLWKSDGTANGTVLLKDVVSQGNWAVFNGQMTFANNDGLWTTNLTNSGTKLISSKGVSFGTTPVAVGSTLYFRGFDSTHGDELWKTDGTDAGTVMVKDINPGDLSTDIQSLTNFNGVLYFSGGEELWTSDGTAAGTVQISDFALNSFSITDASPLVVNGDDLYFSAGDAAHGQELWKFNELSSNLTLVKDVNVTAPDFLTTAHRNGLIYDTIVGTSGDDVVTLASSGDYFVATLNGKAMVLDPVSAGTGQVVINTLAGDDSIDASAYPFELSINAGDGADSVSSGSGGDLIIGGSGNDTIFGNDGADRITGDDGKDHLYGNGGSDTVYGGTQSDFIRGNGGRDHLYGNGGNDSVYGGESGDWLYGQGGNDQLNGEGGNDRLYADYATGNSTLNGGAGDDLLVSKNGLVDQLFGDGGHDSATADATDVLVSIESH